MLFLCYSLSDPNLSASSNTSSTDTNKMNPEKLTESHGNNVDNSAILLTLLKQINLLHETNTKICKNLHDTKGKTLLIFLSCVYFVLLNL